MRIVIVHDQGVQRRWHQWLAQALARNAEHHVELACAPPVRSMPTALSLVQELDRLVYRRRGQCASDLCNEPSAKSEPFREKLARTSVDLVIDLSSGGVRCPAGTRLLTPLYDGCRDELAAIDGHLSHRPVAVSIFDSSVGRAIECGRVATDPNKIFASFDNVACQTLCALMRRVSQVAAATATPSTSLAPAGNTRIEGPANRHIVGHFLAGLVVKLTARLSEMCGYGATWGVGWRRTQRDLFCETGTSNDATYMPLANNKGSFFADPFVIFRDGRYHVFVEEFDYAQGKGVISTFTIETDGTTTPSQVVLDRPYHLSYPFVFERDGQTWMIPESYASARVELYRARAFPHDWVLESVLIDGIHAYDATLCEHDGRLWLLMATSQWQHGSPFSWDRLDIYHAQSLHGPWQPVAANPALIDPLGARPAGRMFRRGGALWRPAQDCSGFYGAGLSICRVDRLETEGFEQTIWQSLAPWQPSQLKGVHTLNGANGVELIDTFGLQTSTPIRLAAQSARQVSPSEN